MRSRHLAALLILPALVISACSANSTPPAPKPSTTSAAPVPTVTTPIGVTVNAPLGSKPKVVIPKGLKAPAKLTATVVSAGTGRAIQSLDTVIVNFQAQTWDEKFDAVNIFNSTFSTGQPNVYVAGKGQVLPGWDVGLIGKKIGSRILLTLPPAEGYGPNGAPSSNITATDTLVFVIDLLADYPPDAGAPGVAVADLPTTGLPKLLNPVGKEPSILSTVGVEQNPATPVPTVLVTGTGAKIDPNKTLVVQTVQTDIATGGDTASTWDKGPLTVSASQVVHDFPGLPKYGIGTRVLILEPAKAAIPANPTTGASAVPAQVPTILIADIIGQF